MNQRMTRQEILAAAMRQSAIDCACTAEDFLRGTHVIVESKPSADASRYLTVPHICTLFSYGPNIVASCRGDLIPEVEQYLGGIGKMYHCFDAPGIYDLNRILQKANARIGWMHSFFLPDPGAIYAAERPCPYETRELHPEDFTELYLPEWSNALCSSRKELDMLGVGAYDGDRLIGLAGCSADCAEMWQIGIDVLPEYRRRGVASALTNRLARAVFERGKIPFYAAAWANVPSLSNARKSGFAPAWAVITAEETGKDA